MYATRRGYITLQTLKFLTTLDQSNWPCAFIITKMSRGGERPILAYIRRKVTRKDIFELVGIKPIGFCLNTGSSSHEIGEGRFMPFVEVGQTKRRPGIQDYKASTNG